MALAPRGTPLYQTTYGNVAPRVGLAYQLSQKPNWGSVVRAGFGTFYDLGSGSLGGVSSYFPYNGSNNFFLRTISASECCSSSPHHQSTCFRYCCGRPQLKASAHLSMERRTGAVDGNQPKSIPDLRRCDRAQVASRH